MGLDINAVQFLISARQKGTRFDQTLMLGRQGLNVYPRKMVSLLEKHGLPAEKFKAANAECAYAEPFFEALGGIRVESLDFSNFEGAKFVHDLNLPIPASMKEQFDVVYDGGTLEHVFNFPNALRNAMELLRPGGRLFIQNCANNLCGHGFYQFSPELFYRALSPENGFEVERMVIHRVGPYGGWWEVSDPNTIRERVELITFTPMHLMVQAHRTEVKEVFAKMPQQSDYTVRWTAEKPEPEAVKTPLFPRLSRLLHVLKMGVQFYRRQSLGNRRFFSRTRREDK
jgi:SAM-dependent methyltransferase